MLRMGLDIGGTKIELAVLDDASGATLLTQRMATPGGAYEDGVRAVARLIGEARQTLGDPATIGIGLPGTVMPDTGQLVNAHALVFNDHAFKPDLETLLGCEVRMANDARCFALSEARDGAAAGAPVAFGAILGTGVGGGVVVRDQVLTGRNAVAGEWGHNPLPGLGLGDELASARPAPRCGCGRFGCIEAFLSGPSLARDHALSVGTLMDPAAIFAAADEGEPQAAATVSRYEERLARALASAINFFDPDVIVLGGGVSRATRLYREVPQRWQRHVYGGQARTRLLPALHGDASGVRGAAFLWPSK